MGFKDIIIGFAMVSIFAVAMITSGVLFGLDNNAEQSLLDDNRLSEFNQTLTSNINEFSSDGQSKINSSLSQYETQGEKEDDDGFSLNPFRILKTMYGTTILFSKTLFGFMKDTLGIPGLLLNVIAGIIVILIIILSWRVWKAGGT